ncbi:MAG: choice-of-anchor L domain-containing protein [Lewinellaceae bacterium]|nr:choice-of-anchor L domain-containing protein [Lewinellaceae bacterium]
MRLFTPLFPILLLLLAFSAPMAVAQSTISGEPLPLDAHYQRHQITLSGTTQLVELQNLLPGERYSFVAAGEVGTGTCKPALSIPGPGNPQAVYDADAGMISFVPESESIVLQLEFPCTWNPNAAPEHYITIVCETCKKKSVKAFMDATQAVLEVEGGYSADALIREVLVGGNCFDITNVTLAGNGGQIGKFSNGVTNIGFANGMIMATGDISVAPGPNDQDNASAGYGNSTPDPDLQTLANGGATFDMCNIEFDFTPTQTPLTFNYVFGSEEYCEYVGSQFNDVFGFFVSGPGISGPFSGAQNIAVLPGGASYVSINNVNHITNTGFYTNNTGAGGQLCGQNPSFLPGVNEVQYDGYTKQMVAVANVIPCETYHVKLKIADVGDGIFDSAVFLKAGSFDGGGNASVDFVVNGDPDIDVTYEACGTVTLVFDRVGGNLNVPLAVQYTIGGTATPGADYSPIPPIVIIPAGIEQVILTINILNDQILEGTESIIITLASPCSCLNPEEILLINDLPQLAAMADTVTICGSGVGTLNAFPDGGVGPYTYQWSNGSNDESMTAFVGASTNFRVTITDDCGKTSVATGRINVSPPPIGQLLAPAPQICPGGSATLNVNFIGTGPFELNYTINGDDQPPIYDLSSPFQLMVTQPGLYQIASVVDSAGCPGPGQGALLVVESALDLVGVPSNVSCSGSTNGSINTTVTGGQGPYNYNWQGPINIGNIPDPINLPAGLYNVTVTDGFGCTDDLSFTLAPPNPILPDIVGTTIANCNNPTGGSVDLNVMGGNPAYAYLWNNGATTQDPTNLSQGTYTVTITDQSNCTTTITATVPGDFVLPTALATAPGPINCINTSIMLDGSGSSSGSNFLHQWNASPGNIVSGDTTLMPTVNQNGNYILVVTNTSNGCTKADTVAVVTNQTLPTASAGPNQTINCNLATPTLDGSASSQGGNFTYNWTTTGGGIILSGDSTLNPVVSATGNYIIMVTDTINGCIRTDTAVVNINVTPPNAVAATPPVLTCTQNSVTLDGSGSTPNGTITYFWSSSNGTIASGETTPNPVVTAAGDYTLVVTNTLNGCMDSTTISVLPDNSIPVVAAAFTDTITCAVTVTTLDGTGSSTGANYTYEWMTSNGNILSGQNNLQATAGAPGQYTLIVTNTTNSCTSTFNVDVPSDLVNPVADAGNSQILSCTNPLLTLDGSNSSTGAQYSYVWTASNGGNITAGNTTLNPEINASGTYNLVVTNNANGCTSENAVDILNDAANPVILIVAPATLNCTDTQITVDASGSSTGSNYAYIWSGPGIVSNNDSALLDINQPGDYTLVITNSDNGCTTEETITVPQDITNPPADAGPDDILNCYNPTLSLGGPGNPIGAGYTFSWTGPGILSGGNTANPSIDQPGNYTLVVTNTANGCSSTDLTAVNINVTPPMANGGPTFELNCFQNTFDLQATASQGPSFGYQWTTTNGGFLSAQNILQPTVNAPGTYNLTVTDSNNGCTSTASVVITESADIPPVEAGTAATLTCNVTNVQLNGAGSATGPEFSYTWSTINGGVIQNPNTLTPTVGAPGLYVLTVLNTTNNCSDVDTVQVPQNITPPPADAGATATLTCSNPSLNLQGTANGPDAYSYLWQPQGAGNIVGINTILNPVVDAAGIYVLTVTNTQTGCTSTDQVQIDINQIAPVSAVAAPALLTCATTQIALDASASSTGNMNYNWNTPTGNIVNTNNPLAPIVDQPGSYQLLVTDQDNGCTAVFSVEVNQDIQNPTANAGADGLLTCAVVNLQLDGIGSSQGNFSYLWTGPGTITNGTTLTPGINTGGNYMLQVTNLSNGCTSTDNVLVNVNTTPPLVAIANPASLTCTSLAVTLDGSGSQPGPGMQYQWTTTNGNILSGPTSTQPVVNQPGIYQLLVTNNNNGCTSTATTTVPQDIALPNAEAGPGFFLTCAQAQVNLQGSGSTGANFSYNWTTQGGSIVSGSNTLSPVVNLQGLYTLQVTNLSNGCTQTDLVQIDQETNVPTDLQVQLDPPSCLDNDGMISFTNVAGGVGPFVYSIDGGNTFYPNTDFLDITPGNYTLWIQDLNGCEYQESLVVPQAPDPQITIIPEINITLGDSVQLKAQLPPGYPLNLIDTIIWTPLDGLRFTGTDLLSLLKPFAKPFQSTEYTVTLISGEDALPRTG